MKNSILIFGFAFCLVNMAAAADLNCPKGTKLITSCAGVDRQGDSEFAVNFMNKAVICKKSGSTLIQLDGKAWEKPSEPAVVTVESRVGGVSYSFKDPEVSFTLSRGTATGPSRTSNGTFTVTLEGHLNASRSLVCTD